MATNSGLAAWIDTLTDDERLAISENAPEAYRRAIDAVSGSERPGDFYRYEMTRMEKIEFIKEHGFDAYHALPESRPADQ